MSRRWRVREVPGRALLFVVPVQLVGPLSAAIAVSGDGAPGSARAAAGAFAAAFLVVAVSERLFGVVQDEGTRVTTQAFGPLVVALSILCPGPLAAAAAWSGSLAAWSLRRTGLAPSPLYKALFSAGQVAGAAWAGAAVFSAAVGVLPVGGWQFAAAALAAGVAIETVGKVLLIAVLVLCGAPLREVAASQVRRSSEELVLLGLGALIASSWRADRALALWGVPLLFAYQRSLLHQQLLEQARSDGKTGLVNASHWSALTDRALTRAAAGGSPVSVLLIDLDRFKAVNDTHGHVVGDDVLKEVAQRIQGAVRPGDVVGRFGGEEFVALLPACDAEVALAVAERIRGAVSDTPVPAGPDLALLLPVTCSVGTATSAAGEDGSARLLAVADAAVYQAKAAGRNQVRSGPTGQVPDRRAVPAQRLS